MSTFFSALTAASTQVLLQTLIKDFWTIGTVKEENTLVRISLLN
jgi:hypothetical protein